MRRPRRPWIIWPGMSRVAGAQLLAHFRIRVVPEAAQVAGDLDGTAVRREERQHHRLVPPADPRRLGEAEELLQLHRRGHRPIVVVFEARGAAAWDEEHIGRLAIE